MYRRIRSHASTWHTKSCAHTRGASTPLAAKWLSIHCSSLRVVQGASAVLGWGEDSFIRENKASARCLAATYELSYLPLRTTHLGWRKGTAS